MKDINIPERLIPVCTSQEAKLKYDLVAWKMFAQRMQRHPFIKEYILKRDQICQCCSIPFNKKSNKAFQLHHVDYNHFCKFGQTVVISVPGKTRIRKHKLPDCETCFKTHPAFFEECAFRVVAVHPRCNFEISKIKR